ncbi:hypothetical protein GGR51DRAFT_513312 [Nemania sp. FL0031]|nr:hypothetical protein GGR51DRAFT_513312 [Nemania sp. FL0031]
MFTTFSAQMSPVPLATSTTPPNGTNGKRRKVARACDSCRLNRVRCDDDRPCENCRTRGEKCTNTMPWEAHSLPAAKREIERLQDRLKQLQNQQLTATANTAPSPPTPPDVPISGSNPKATVLQQGSNQSILNTNDNAGQATRGQDSPWGSYSNSSSSSATPALVHRSGYHAELDQSSSERGKPTSDRRNESQTTFSRSKERQFLSLFWKGFPWLHPILDMEDIYRHHDSLWNEILPGEQQTRSPSALIDVLLALSMQYGSTFLLRDSPDNSTQWILNSRSGNASLAGQSFCQRSHRLHLERSQSSTLESVQCCILSSVYFLNAGSLDKANMALAEGIRMAQILGLHEHPPFTSSDPKYRRLQSNIWRLLIVLDGHYAILLGLPPLIQPVAEERLAMDFWQCTVLDDTNNNHDSSRAWESYHTYHMKLTFAAHSVHAHFLQRKGELLRQGYGGDLQSPLLLESFAESMNQKLEIMRKWTETVPPALTIPRPGGGGPFSAVWASVLDLDSQAPLHVQQQRLSLELIYHHLSLLLIREFVCFVHKHQNFPQTKQVDILFMSGLKHAISIISVMNQALSNEDAITGWLFFFGCQWDATLYLLNYITVYPAGSFVRDTRRSLGTAMETLILMGKYLNVAKNAQGIVKGALGRDVTHPSREPNNHPANDPRVFDPMGSVDTGSAFPLSSFLEEDRTVPWNDYRTILVPNKEFSWGSTTSTVQPDPFGSLTTPRTASNPTLFRDPFLLDSNLNQSPLAHQDLDDMVDIYSFLGDWQPAPFNL